LPLIYPQIYPQIVFGLTRILMDSCGFKSIKTMAYKEDIFQKATVLADSDSANLPMSLY